RDLTRMMDHLPNLISYHHCKAQQANVTASLEHLYYYQDSASKKHAAVAKSKTSTTTHWLRPSSSKQMSGETNERGYRANMLNSQDLMTLNSHNLVEMMVRIQHQLVQRDRESCGLQGCHPRCLIHTPMETFRWNSFCHV
ncbi:hypothetical protein HK096_000257, partial [Nowakowskiella sp. JEL0078]